MRLKERDGSKISLVKGAKVEVIDFSKSYRFIPIFNRSNLQSIFMTMDTDP